MDPENLQQENRKDYKKKSIFGLLLGKFIDEVFKILETLSLY